jgi:hypothetical protein
MSQPICWRFCVSVCQKSNNFVNVRRKEKSNPIELNLFCVNGSNIRVINFNEATSALIDI